MKIKKYLPSLPVFVACLLTGLVGLGFGRYLAPSPAYCQLEESRAIEGCERAASGLMNDLRGCTQEVELWQVRANQCARVLLSCMNYLQQMQQEPEQE